MNFIYTQLDRLNRKCWVAGGAVRDILLGRHINDIDLVTDAAEAEILKLFPQAILVGKQFGVYKIPLKNEVIDLTVFREEDEYHDHRRPLSVKPSTPEMDAKRRDFTINALFWDLKNNKLIDFVGGEADLKAHILKCVGDAEHRLSEDALRILRVARFEAQLGFTIDLATEKAAKVKAELVRNLSGERIISEIIKISEPKSQLQFWTSELTRLVFDKLGFKFNNLDLVGLNSLNRVGLDTDFVILRDMYFIIGFDHFNLAKELVQKFKLSGRQRDFLFNLEFIQKVLTSNGNNSEDNQVVSLLIRWDQDVDFKNALLAHFKSDDVFLNRLIKLKKENETLLLTASDVLDFLKGPHISAGLLEVRKLQFLGQLSTKNEALFWLKNHFFSADTNET